MAHPQPSALVGHIFSHAHNSSQKKSQSRAPTPELDFPLDEVASDLYWHLFDWFDLDHSIKVTVDSASSLPEFLLAYGRTPPSSSDEISTELYPLKTVAITATYFQSILLIQDYYLADLVHRQGGEFRFFDTKVSGDERIKSQRRLQSEIKALIAAEPPIKINEKKVAQGILKALGINMEGIEPLSPADIDITPVTPFLFVSTKELRPDGKTPTSEKDHKQADLLHALQQPNGSFPRFFEKPGPSYGQPALRQKKPRLSASDPLAAATLVRPYIQSKASSKAAGPSSNNHSSLPHMKSHYPITVATSKSQHPKVPPPKLVEQSGRFHDQLASPHKKPRISTTTPVATSDQPRLKSKMSLPNTIRSSDSHPALLHTKLYPSTDHSTNVAAPRDGIKQSKRKESR